MISSISVYFQLAIRSDFSSHSTKIGRPRKIESGQDLLQLSFKDKEQIWDIDRQTDRLTDRQTDGGTVVDGRMLSDSTDALCAATQATCLLWRLCHHQIHNTRNIQADRSAVTLLSNMRPALEITIIKWRGRGQCTQGEEEDNVRGGEAYGLILSGKTFQNSVLTVLCRENISLSWYKSGKVKLPYVPSCSLGESGCLRFRVVRLAVYFPNPPEFYFVVRETREAWANVWFGVDFSVFTRHLWQFVGCFCGLAAEELHRFYKKLSRDRYALLNRVTYLIL